MDHTIVHFEIPADQPERAAKFYRELFAVADLDESVEKAERLGAKVLMGRPYAVTAPPATSRMTPVIQPDSSEARKSAAAATSSGVPSRHTGCCSIRACR